MLRVPPEIRKLPETNVGAIAFAHIAGIASAGQVVNSCEFVAFSAAWISGQEGSPMDTMRANG